MKNKYSKKLILVVSFLVLSLVIVGSYAFFTASVNGNNLASNNVITTGHMEVTYTDGNVIGSTEKIMPGDSIEKHFRVTNTGTVDSAYDIYLNDVINNFNTKTDLVYELISETGSNKSETTCPDANTKIASSNIGVGVTHNYTLKITYKNVARNQDDNKGKGFRFKIDLVEKEVDEKTIANQLEDLKTLGATDLEYDGVDTLGENGTTDNNLRYVGSNPSNYVYYNCTTTNPDEMNDSTCEKWRIIGLMNNVEDENGNGASRVKIMRYEPIGGYSWDSTAQSTNYGRGINQWGESEYEDGTPYEGADLMRELNTDYLGNITVGTDDKWYSGANNSKTVNMPSSTLNQNAQSMIQEVVWHTGSSSQEAYNSYINGDSTALRAKDMYEFERSNNTGKTCTQGGVECNDEVKRTTTWTGKVALMYVSDYLYATSGGTTLNKSACLNTASNKWNNDSNITGISDCFDNTWMRDSVNWQWSITPAPNGPYAHCSFGIGAGGNVGIHRGDLYDKNVARPTLYLKSNVKIDSGDGSSSNPYKLVLE